MWRNTFIQKLQNKPSRERKRIAAYVSTILIIAVIAIWTIQLKYTLRDHTNTAAADLSSNEQKLSQSVPSPLGALFVNTARSAQTLYDETQKQIAAVYEDLYGFIKVIKENEQQLNL